MTHAATHAPPRLASVVGRLATVQLMLRHTRRIFELPARRLLVIERPDLVPAWHERWARGLLGDRINRRLGSA